MLEYNKKQHQQDISQHYNKMSDTVNDSQFSDLCRELNMDRDTEQSAIQMFKEVLQRSSLEGSLLHWFCCSLYVACRQSYTPTVGESNAVVQGNCISLNKLLHSCDMSISDFISKIKVWREMANLPSEFQRQIEKLEHTPGITYLLSKRYSKMFEKIFAALNHERRNTKYSTVDKCSANKLYDLIWCLYLCVKNENPNYNDDLVTSFHLLLCCIDLTYRNVLAENRIDLINGNFEGLPANWGRGSPLEPATVANHCIIDVLCRLENALPSDAKAMKANHFKNIIKKFYQTKTIFGDEAHFLGIVSNQNFERNFKSLNASYEQFVLSVGVFDERILLKNPIGRKTSNIESGNETPAGHHEDIQSLNTRTPLTRRNCLPSEAFKEPVANAADSVKKLKDIAEKMTEPSEFIRQVGSEPLQKIDDILHSMLAIFQKKFPNHADAINRFQTGRSLFYYLLDKILRSEFKTKPHLDLKLLLDTKNFITTLIACAVEIVLAAYRYQHLKFPWILNCFNIPAFQFIKIIEMVVRCHDNVLTRELVKHLNSIEESCLESLVWQRPSMLWDTLKMCQTFPTWRQVDVEGRRTMPLRSPIDSAYDSFSTPASVDSTRRDLFNTAADRAQMQQTQETPTANEGRCPSSIHIFCRKFYKLAWLRLKELCHEIDLDKEEHLNTIWTLFEYAITEKTELMKDRHLDQNILCIIYLYVKVKPIDMQFADILKFYRKQPQATSSIYRTVLMKTTESTNGEPTPEYDDIIQYYNKIVVPFITPYASNFTPKNRTPQDLTLSPHPPEHQTHPKKLSQNHSLFVSLMEKSQLPPSPLFTYEFRKSPGNDGSSNLETLNQIIKTGKRDLQFGKEEATVETKRKRTRIQLTG